MGALINIFKRLFGGIFGFMGGLFGEKKGKDGFFMEADSSMMEELPAATAIVAEAAAPVAAKAEKGKKDKSAVKAVPAKVPAKAMTTEELIVAAVQGKSVESESAASVGTAGFATQYLVPTLTSGRRSPGPSMKMFKSMAKEIRG